MGKNVALWSPPIGDLNLTAALLAQVIGYADPIGMAPLTTAGNGVLTAALLTGGTIVRTGPTGAFTDTTDTAAAIVTALGGFQAALVFGFQVKNATAFVDTLAAGTGITLPAAKFVPPFGVASYIGTVGGTAASPTVTIAHLDTVPVNTSAEVAAPQSAALATVGAGTILAAAINGGYVARGGAQTNTPFTDTTDTAANLVAGVSALTTTDGSSAVFTYVNNTNATATIAGGTGVTVSVATVVPPNSFVKYLVTRTSATAVTFAAVEQGAFPKKGTAVANGATPVAVTDALVTADSIIVLTLKTAGGTPHGAFVSAVTPGTGFSINSLAGDTSTYNYEIRG